MSRLLSLNLDLVLILQGGLLLLLTTASRGISQRDTSLQPWRWFAWYAFLQAIRTGIEVVIYESTESPLLTFINQAFLAGASLCLLEFARASFSPDVKRWIHLPLAGGFLLAVFWAGETGAAWSGFTLALLAGGCAAATLWHGNHAPHSLASARLLRPAGLILIACQLLTAWPDPTLLTVNAELFAALSPQIVRGALFFLLTIIVYHHQLAHNNPPRTAEQSSSRQRRQTLCLLGIILIGLTGWLGANLTGEHQDKMMRQQILARTEIAAAAIHAEDVSQLHWDETDLTNPAYLKLKAQLIAMRHANSDLRFVLLAGIREQKAYFLADSEDPASKDYSPPGQAYDEATPDYLTGLASNHSFVLGPETDRWGTWVFGDVPIFDANNHCLAYLELNIAAADWDARIRQARLPVLLITLLIVAIVLGSFQALERLRESSAQIALSEQRNRSLVEGSPDCVQMFDLAGRYLSVNQNGLHALGLTETNVLGKKFSDLWPLETRAKIDEAVRSTITGQPTSFEADYLTPDSRLVTWRVATNPIYDTAGRVCSFVGICVDLTARKQMEIALLAAKKTAEEATQAKSDFLAVMSHEIRTPLAGVIGMLDLLQQVPLEPQPRRYTRFARDSADTLLHLLDDALDSAKMEAGKLTLETIPFHPYEYFEAAFESAKMRAASKGLAFHHEVAPSVPPVLLGDPTRLRQIISNLINNALKFTEKGSVSVTLSAEPISIGSVLLKIAVSDTGIGISEENRARLFAKYAQAESSTTRHYGGTGLGLSIVKSLAELMGGEVNVTSTLGQGSTFAFSGGFKTGPETACPAPVVRSAPKPLEPPVNAPPTATTPKHPLPPRSAPARPLRILVVDDDVSNRTVAESIVTFLGHRDMAFAVNGREAVDRLIKEKFDVVLMDNRMPIMDGFTATRLIRDPATGATDPEIYIIALTANASADDRAKCLAGGMNDFVTKPVRSPAIGAALARAIEHLQTRAKISAPAPIPVTATAPTAPNEAPPGLSEAELLASLDEAEAALATSTPDENQAMSPDMLEKLTAVFIRESPRRIASMRTAFTQQQTATIALEAHTLKSNARYMNDSRLAELCAQLEKLADQKQLAQIEPILRETEQVFAALLERLLHPTTV